MAYLDQITATVRRVSDDGVVVAVDGRQRAHAFDVAEIGVCETSRQSLPVEIGETITIISDGMRTTVTLD